jgi:hypothetical protein
MQTLKDRILERVRNLGNQKAAEFFGVNLSTIGRWLNEKKPTEPNLAAAEIIFAEVLEEKNNAIERLSNAMATPYLSDRVLNTLERQADLSSPDLIGQEVISLKEKPNAPTAAQFFGLQPVDEAALDASIEARAKQYDLKPGEQIIDPSKIDPTGEVIQEQPKLNQPGALPIGANPAVMSEEAYNELVKAAKAPVQEQPRAIQSPAVHTGKPEVILCLPVAEKVYGATNLALIALAKRHGKRLGFEQLVGESCPVRMRNRLAERFLATGSDWSLWIDSDMIPPIGNPNWYRGVTGARHTGCVNPDQDSVDRLLSRNQPLIGAVYAQRSARGIPVVGGVNPSSPTIQSAIKQGPVNNIVESAWLGFGLTLVHRSVFEAIKQLSDPNNHIQNGRTGFFNKLGEDGEDFSFCKRATAAGIKCYLDLGLVAGHIGNKAFLPE